jgi:hypothetical protein
VAPTPEELPDRIAAFYKKIAKAETKETEQEKDI